MVTEAKLRRIEILDKPPRMVDQLRTSAARPHHITGLKASPDWIDPDGTGPEGSPKHAMNQDRRHG